MLIFSARVIINLDKEMEIKNVKAKFKVKYKLEINLFQYTQDPLMPNRYICTSI